MNVELFQSQHIDEVTALGAFFQFHIWEWDLTYKMAGKLDLPKKEAGLKKICTIKTDKVQTQIFAFPRHPNRYLNERFHYVAQKCIFSYLHISFTHKSHFINLIYHRKFQSAIIVALNKPCRRGDFYRIFSQRC